VYDEKYEGKTMMTFELNTQRELEREHAVGQREKNEECIVVQVIDGGGMTFSRSQTLGECKIPLSLVRMSGMQHGSRKVGMDFRVFCSWFELQGSSQSESPSSTRTKSSLGPPGLAISTSTKSSTPGAYGEIQLVLTVVCAANYKDAHTRSIPDPWSLEKNRLKINNHDKIPIYDEYGFTIPKKMIGKWWYEQSHNRMMASQQSQRWKAMFPERNVVGRIKKIFGHMSSPFGGCEHFGMLKYLQCLYSLSLSLSPSRTNKPQHRN